MEYLPFGGEDAGLLMARESPETHDHLSVSLYGQADNLKPALLNLFRHDEEPAADDLSGRWLG